MGQTIVIINDANIAFELLDKRSIKYSSRPKLVFSGEMLALSVRQTEELSNDMCRVGWEDSVGFSGYNERFKTYRKNMARIIGSKTAAAEYNGLQEAEVGHFLLHVLEKPENLVDHIRKFVFLHLLLLLMLTDS